MTGLRYRKRIAVVPRHLFLNISRSASRGWTFSWSVKAFGVTYNLNRKRTTADLPGGLYYEANGKRKGTRKGSVKSSVKGSEPVPYSPARWPYALLGILLVLAVIGGSVWQSILVFGLIALVVFLVQRGRSRRAGTPANRDAVTPASEPLAADPVDAERIVREWAPPAGWEKQS